MKQLFVIFLMSISLNVALAQEGSFTDARDGKTYKTVTIEGVTIMSQNLAYIPEGVEYFYLEDKKENIEKYGVMYPWAVALDIIPEGWRLPSKLELRKICYSYGSEGDEMKKGLENGEFAVDSKAGYFDGETYVNDVTKIWTSNACGPDITWCLFVDKSEGGMSNENTKNGLYIRLVKK